MAGTDGLRGKPSGVVGRQTSGGPCSRSSWPTGGDLVDVVGERCPQVLQEMLDMDFYTDCRDLVRWYMEKWVNVRGFNGRTSGWSKRCLIQTLN